VSSEPRVGSASELPLRDQAPLPRLGYLLKQAHLRFVERAAAALAPLGIGPREWAALVCFDDEHGLSQAQVAQRLGIDRTTMVALVDEMQTKGLVTRQPDSADRRKNHVKLTPHGRQTLKRGATIADETESDFLNVLSQEDSERLKAALNVVLQAVDED